MTFEELGLAQPILRAVTAEGYLTPTPIQAKAIPHLMEGRDLLGSAQTGTGKTAAFALPILHRLTQPGAVSTGSARRIRVLILAPTRELASQIGESLQVYGANTTLRQVVIFGGVGQQPQVRALQRGVDILVATPGRLVDLMGQGYVDLKFVTTFVLDEADRMLDMGFMPDLRRVIARLPTQRQTVFFSATMPSAIEQLANTILKNPVRIEIAPIKANTDLIVQSVCFIAKQQKSRLLVQFIRTQDIRRAIVFARTKRGADRIAQDLDRCGIPAEAMHGNKSQAHRQRTLASFKSERPPILVATDLAARGIDVDGVTHVFNYDLPHEPETYVHRIGRTGRAGATGIAIAFCDHEERAYLRAIERLLRKNLEVDSAPPLHASTTIPPRAPEPVSDRPAADSSEEVRRPSRHRTGRSKSAPRSSGSGSSNGPHRGGPSQNKRPAPNSSHS
ncbi:MAG: ATP-dependent helicase RhlE [Planctomycetaceae bacterium]|nr:ATP-dependent helicase RhlE [Planctomycetaceae bacterium]